MSLNNEQNRAVNHKDGPVLIIAGAGTGKTRVITSRIVNLINKEGIKPENILALTFTEKAANEMVERIDMDMPLGYSELCVKTFHAFSDQLLREKGHEIGIDTGYKILDQVEQWFFFKKHLFEFELDYYRPLGNPNKFIYDLLWHFGKLKDELILPDDYIKYAESLAGEEKDKTLEIARLYKQYQKLLIQNNFLEFGDLTAYSLQLLEKRESVLKEYQEKFKYILIDEFQDTNYAQFKLALMLGQSHKNIFAVGDDDQSIYKWRGASLSNMLQFEKNFPECEKIVLAENYRSTKNILDGSYSLIQNNNPDRMEVKNGINKQLRCNVNDSNDQIEIHRFPSFVQESSFVAEQIQKLHHEGGYEYRDFAILIRANHLAHPFVDELKYLGIPYQVRNPKGLLSLEEIKDLTSVLKFLANPLDDISLLRILRMDVFDIPMAKILEILNKPKKSHLINALTTENLSISFPGMEKGEEKVHEILNELIAFSKKEPIGLVLNEFLQRSGYLKRLIEKDKFEEVENINSFARYVTKFEKDNEDRSVIDFVSYLKLLEEANSPLSNNTDADRDSVQILTAHGAKGLEFPFVFIVDAVNHRFPGTKRSDAFEIPPTLTKEIYPEGDFHLQEERRLFYVAMTRARKQLFITYSDLYEGNKKWKISPFAQEALNSNCAKLIEHEETADAITKLKEFKTVRPPIFDLPPFKRKTLSYSQFDTFKTCPLKYSYRYMIGVPSPQSHAANFGSSIHDTLNQLYKMLKFGKKVNLEILAELYEKNWSPYGYESVEHEEIRKKQGLDLLTEFFKKNSEPWIVPAFLEQPFSIKVGDFTISGRIDRIDRLSDGTFEVIDYKTGRSKDNVNLNKDLQLSIYALACRDVLKIPVSKLSLYYLENNEKSSTERSAQQIDDVKGEIQGYILDMQTSKFNPTPGFLCSFCDYRVICPAV
ncbi:MAG: UvrD-helicase domain-containing protein [Candidatus Gracilibacteria bacterium]|nr:UvrD-helicase domain-containing protein [Candidatus Gracilibacteria bacterium]